MLLSFGAFFVIPRGSGEKSGNDPFSLVIVLEIVLSVKGSQEDIRLITVSFSSTEDFFQSFFKLRTNYRLKFAQ